MTTKFPVHEKKPVKAEDILNHILDSARISTVRDGSGRFTLKYDGNRRTNVFSQYIHDTHIERASKINAEKTELNQINAMVQFLEGGGDPDDLVKAAKSVMRTKCNIGTSTDTQPHEHADSADDDWQSRGGN